MAKARIERQLPRAAPPAATGSPQRDGPARPGRDRWQREIYEPHCARVPERRAEFRTLSGLPLNPLYTPEDVRGSYFESLGFPGEYPYTRGVYPTMYRGRLWTIRQVAGYGTAEDTNARFRYLLEQGETGLSVTFDMPTLMGYDSDHPRARGEVGRGGVAVDAACDMFHLYEGLPLDRLTASLTINCPAAVLLAFYLEAARKMGFDWSVVGGTVQNDILKEYHAQNEWAFPPAPSLSLVVDLVEFCTEHVPRWNTISISGYHMREAGATAVQEVAYTLLDGLTYVQACVDRGLEVDAFAPRFSFFFDIHNDFFEEIAKLRAARRIWAREMRRRFNPQNEKSLLMRCHCQTAGVSLLAQQPMNNIARVAIQALAAVLGGTQSLHTNGYDETYALPTEETAQLAVRTQQIIAHESGIANVIDPVGGSYFVEALTDAFETAVYDEFAAIEGMGGMLAAIERGYVRQRIGDSAMRFQQEVDSGERIQVGLNQFIKGPEPQLKTWRPDGLAEERANQRLVELRRTRDERAWQRAHNALQQAAKQDKNLMPYILECAAAAATEGEIMDALREVLGEYQAPPIY